MPRHRRTDPFELVLNCHMQEWQTPPVTPTTTIQRGYLRMQLQTLFRGPYSALSSEFVLSPH